MFTGPSVESSEVQMFVSAENVHKQLDAAFQAWFTSLSSLCGTNTPWGVQQQVLHLVCLCHRPETCQPTGGGGGLKQTDSQVQSHT